MNAEYYLMGIAYALFGYSLTLIYFLRPKLTNE